MDEDEFANLLESKDGIDPELVMIKQELIIKDEPGMEKADATQNQSENGLFYECSIEQRADISSTCTEIDDTSSEKLFKCQCCDKTFRLQRNYQIHEQTHKVLVSDDIESWEPNIRRPKRLVKKVTSTWTDEEVHRLISTVKEHPCLWNIHLTDYRVKKRRDAAWLIVGDVLNNKFTIDEIIAKWSNLRIQFKSYMAKASKTKDGQDVQIHWRFFCPLLFILTVEQNMKITPLVSKLMSENKDLLVTPSLPTSSQSVRASITLHLPNNSISEALPKVSAISAPPKPSAVGTPPKVSTSAPPPKVYVGIVPPKVPVTPPTVPISNVPPTMSVDTNPPQVSVCTALPTVPICTALPNAQSTNCCKTESVAAKRRRNEEDDVREVALTSIQEALTKINEIKDDYAVFGDFIAAELRKIKKRPVAQKLQRKLQRVLLDFWDDYEELQNGTETN